MAAAYAPLVLEENRSQWEEYAYKNRGWLLESNRLKEVHPGHRDALHGTIQDHEHDRRQLQENEEEGQRLPDISPSIYHWENGARVVETSSARGYYGPLWQISPADASAVNVNLLADKHIAQLFDAMVDTNHSIISQGFPIGDMVSNNSCQQQPMEFELQFMGLPDSLRDSLSSHMIYLSYFKILILVIVFSLNSLTSCLIQRRSPLKPGLMHS